MGEGTERAGAKTAPVAGDGELDRFKGRYRLLVRRVGPPAEREFVDMIEFSVSSAAGPGGSG